MTRQPQPTETSVLVMTSSTFLPLGGTANAVVGLHVTPVLVQLNQQIRPAAMPRGLSAAERAARIARNPARSKALVQGRQRLARVIERMNEGVRPLAALRLAAGLSQSELAARMDMQQPNIARLEKRPGDPSLSTLRKLASALDAPLEEVIAAVDAANMAEGKHG